mgnify:CR=1 FL=1
MQRHPFLLKLARRLRYFLATWGFTRALFGRRLNVFAPEDGPRLSRGLSMSYRWLWLRMLEAPDDLGLKREATALGQEAAAYCARQRFAEHPEQPLPTFDWRRQSADDFVREHIDQIPHPVVLKGFAADCPAVIDWSVDSFVDRFPDVEVQFIEGDRGKLERVRTEGRYAHNAETLFDEDPALERALQVERLLPFAGNLAYHYSQMFLGYKATGSPLHAANTWNFFLMVDGAKKWTFIDPEYSEFVHATLTENMVYALSESLSFPHAVDPEQHPMFRFCPRYTVLLEPGDVLLNPPWWWHAIENVTPSSVGVSSRWSSPLMNEPTNRMFLMLQMFSGKFWQVETEMLCPPKENQSAARRTRERVTH